MVTEMMQKKSEMQSTFY